LTAADKQWVDYLVASYDQESIEDYLLHLLGLKSYPKVLAIVYREALVKIHDLKTKGLLEAHRKQFLSTANRIKREARQAIGPTIPPLNPARGVFLERTRQLMEKSGQGREKVAALFEFVEQHRLWDVIALLMLPSAKKEPGRPTGPHDRHGDVERIKKMRDLIDGRVSVRQAAVTVVNAIRRPGGNLESQTRRLVLAFRDREALRTVEI
jgi:hypothetical protein